MSLPQVLLLVFFILFVQRVVLEQPRVISEYGSVSSGMDASVYDKAASSTANNLSYTPLAIPEGQAPNLPSIRVVEKESVDDSRNIYGGKGDKKHLGGFTEIDMHGISPAVWKHAVDKWTVQSVLDVGCGRGISTSWFVTHGLRTECVEGSHDAIEQSMVPDKSILTEHDFSRGPWWPGQTFDMVWSVEFLEHVNVQFHYNYISTFRKAAIILCTSSLWGGWHHVEVHDDEWWIRKYQAYGFVYDDKLTKEMRSVATQEKGRNEEFPPNGQKLNAQHVWLSLKVFVNPAVAALPEHAHLFGEFGCFQGNKQPKRECGTAKSDSKHDQDNAKMETPRDPAFYPLKLTEAQDQRWYDIVKANIHTKTEE